MKPRQFLHKLHWQPAVAVRYSEYKKHVLPGRSLNDLTRQIMASTGECCVVSYFLNDWQHFVDPSSRHHLVRFCEALRQQFQTSFVFVGGCASMFCLPPAYNDAVNNVIETFRHMGIACNNAPETHQLPLCNDKYHFHPDAEPLLLAMWEKAVIELARPCSQPLAALPRSVDRSLAVREKAVIELARPCSQPLAALPRSVANRWTRRHRSLAVPTPSPPPPPPLCNFRMDGPYRPEPGRVLDTRLSVYFYDHILEKFVWEPYMPNGDPQKNDFLPRLQNFATLRWEVPMELLEPLGHERPTVFLLTSGDPQCQRHATKTAAMFGDLGFEVVPIAGFTQSDWPSIMEANVPKSARKGHLAWLTCFLPKLLSLTQRANKSGQWLIAEDSAWPATFATPTNINKYVAEHGNCWLGYRNSMRNGKLPRCKLPHKLDNNGRITTTDEKQHVRAPYGLKLLALDDQAIRLLYRAFCQLPVQFCAEHYFKLLLLLSKHEGSVHFTVADTPFAGSAQHFSLVDGKPQVACVPAPIKQHCLMPDGNWC